MDHEAEMRANRRAKIEKRSVDGCQPDEGGPYVLTDTLLPGFRLRVRSSGRKTYELRYYAGRVQRLYVIGDHGAPWTADEARKEAGRVMRAVEQGEDPQGARKSARAALTIAELCPLYLEKGPEAKPNKRARSWETDASNFARHVVPLLGKRVARDLTAADLEAWQKDVVDGKSAFVEDKRAKGAARDPSLGPARGRVIVKGGRSAAIRAMRSLSGMLSWAADPNRGYVATNVALGVEKMSDRKRATFLPPALAARAWRLLDEMEADDRLSPMAADMLRLLALTGGRRSEIRCARKPEVDWAASCIRLAVERHKAGEETNAEKVIVLSSAALAVLARRWEALELRNAADDAFKSDYLFANADGSQPIEFPRRHWNRFKAALGVDKFRPHDFRHSFASLLVNKPRASLKSIGDALGHARPETTNRYAHLFDETVRQAAEDVAASYASPAAQRASRLRDRAGAIPLLAPKGERAPPPRPARLPA